MHSKNLPSTSTASKPNKRSRLKTPRSHAFRKQHGCCYYCGQPMWDTSEQELTSRFPISPRQARLLKCTGEHLVAHSEGGSSSAGNIVAACWYCNKTRHAGRKAFSPDRFKDFTRRRMSKGAWHGLRLTG